MKNNKIFYLLTILITLFSFNMKASAAQELTCVYEHGPIDNARILIQDKNGKKEIYTNEDQNAKIESKGWNLQGYAIDISKVDTDYKDTNGNLSTCPKYSNLKDNKVYFGDEKNEISFTLNPSEKIEDDGEYASVKKLGPEELLVNDNVQELTCVYEHGANGKLVLIQRGVNDYEFYLNNRDVEIDTSGWTKKIFKSPWFDWENLNNVLTTDGKPHLTSCPQKARILNDDQVYFHGSNISNAGNDYKNLENNGEYKSIKKIGGATTDKAQTTDPSGSLYEIDGTKYVGYCKYKRMLPSGKNHYIQINIGKEDILATEYDPIKENYLKLGINGVFSFYVDNNFTASAFLSRKGGNCLNEIYVNRDEPNNFDINTGQVTIGINTAVSISNTKLETYLLDSVGGKNPITGLDLTLDDTYGNISFGDINIVNCEELLGKDIAGYLGIIWNFVKIGIPIILVGLGILDFAQAIFAGKEDNMKKVQEKFIKRVIIAVIIFLVPTILSLLLNIANSIWDNIGTDVCGLFF